MVILLDADVIIRGEKGLIDLERWCLTLPEDEFALASITIAEIWHGVERATGEQRKRRREYLERFTGNLSIFSYTNRTALEHARIWAELEAAGKMMGYYDLIVAATALDQGCSVATFNVRHFLQVKGLAVIEPG